MRGASHSAGLTVSWHLGFTQYGQDGDEAANYE